MCKKLQLRVVVVGGPERVCLNREELMTDYEVKIQSISVRELLNR